MFNLTHKKFCVQSILFCNFCYPEFSLKIRKQLKIVHQPQKNKFNLKTLTRTLKKYNEVYI